MGVRVPALRDRAVTADGSGRRLFVASERGAVFALDARTGCTHWYETVNGVAGQGGSINGPGPVVVDGMVYVNSGYAAFGGRPGNVLLAFGID